MEKEFDLSNLFNVKDGLRDLFHRYHVESRFVTVNRFNSDMLV